MTGDDFRRLALDLPDTVESSHMGHPDFRVGGKIFATLSPEPGWAMVKLAPEEQEAFLRAAPEVFSRVNGAWGRQGATRVQLKKATRAVARDGLTAAWRLRAPRRIVEAFDREK